MKEHYDVIVVGARCAGAATARLLAQAGLSVLVIDKARYGSDTVSTHALMRGGALQLQRWGLLDEIRAHGTPAIHNTHFFYGPSNIVLEEKPFNGVDALYAPRRTVLDRVLVDAAERAGVEFSFRTRLENLVWRAGRVVGAELVHRGKRRCVFSKWVVGADGAASTVAELVSAPTLAKGKHTIACVLGYLEGLESKDYRWYFGDKLGAGVIPTNGGHCVFAALPPSRLSEAGSDYQAFLRSLLLEAAPQLRAGLEQASFVGGIRSFRGRQGHLKRSAGPGWALVGDAGYFKDPLTAHGITDALRDAELLARSLVEGNDGALYEYQGIRDELSRPLFELSDEIASFNWTLQELPVLHFRVHHELKREVRFLRSRDLRWTQRETRWSA